MRLAVLNGGQGVKRLLMLRLAPLVFGLHAPDVLRILWYREKFMGRPLNRLTEQLLRGTSEWSVGERELFAAFVSSKNRCRFCAEAHSATAAAALGIPVVDGKIDESKVSEKVRAMLPFLERLTTAPLEVNARDLAPARKAGVSEDAILDAVYICAVFCMFNRLTESFGAELVAEADLPKLAKVLLTKGYDT
jgi:uncharacterized peroxidase-related enzyme